MRTRGAEPDSSVVIDLPTSRLVGNHATQQASFGSDFRHLLLKAHELASPAEFPDRSAPEHGSAAQLGRRNHLADDRPGGKLRRRGVALRGPGRTRNRRPTTRPQTGPPDRAVTP